MSLLWVRAVHDGTMSWDEIRAKHPVYANPRAGFDDAVNELASSHPEFEGEMTTPHLRYTEQEVHPSKVRFQRYPADDARVQSVLDGYHSGADVPPVLLVHRAGEYHVADGHHRMTAAEMLGVHAPAVIAHSPRTDRYSGRASLGRTKRPTR